MVCLVELLTGHTIWGLTCTNFDTQNGKNASSVGMIKKSVHIVCDCLVLAFIEYRIWGGKFLKLADLEEVKVSSLLSLVANTRLHLVS
jgi:hypothetical protein